ncbi:MAG: bifunctional 4-hydroxy-3-methylbut-2-enyl diphosphate reductase/30S ribosomal protein S1 [Clostridiaceae bacterium]|nr:bifunctional 4-hydroxy-3-methylbut-2-enyl diphosphate reductase/30S ribosomal protein S1 [Clostridiaceae bacterium]
MRIILAETAGFCFGVDNAVRKAYELLDGGERIFTLGAIIHNEQVVDDLKSRGAEVISDIDGVPDGSKVIIRAHGVTPDIYEAIKRNNIQVVDTTCPYVRKIHMLVKKKCNEGCRIVIAGDREHPEVKGINGWCGNTAFIANTPEEMDSFPQTEETCCLVAQTTITKEKFEGIYDKLKEKCKNVLKFDTICNATSNRQEETRRIARQSDVMLVIGSKNSSNTQKLYEISKKYCEETYLIETYGDLPPINIKKINTLGITAGASTPERTIKEVIEKMDELNKQENEMSFEEAFENSIVTLRSGEIVKGRIIGYNNAEIYVDLGYKSDGIIPVSEYTDDPDFKPEASIKIGDEIEVFIVRVNDGEGNVMLSKKKVDSMKSIDEIEQAYENKTPVTGKVVETTNGGVIASVNGVRVFIPASQLSERYVKDLNEYLRQTVTVKIVEFNKQRRKIVGSRRIVLAENREQIADQFWSGIEVGKKYDGIVKSLMDFGAFIDIGGVDGLVHVSEMSWTKIKHPSDVLKVGDKVEVTVIEFDAEKKRISLTMKKEEDNPWFKAAEKYKVGDIVKGTVVRLVPFGAFIELEKGLDGLVHISQISNVRIAKPGDVLQTGQETEAKIVEVNVEAKKISLSIKEVNPIDPPSVTVPEKEAQETVETADVKAAVEDEVPNEHREELANTIGDALSTLNEKE